MAAVVTEIVVGNRDLRRGLGDALLADRDCRLVLRLWPFFECVIAHDQRAAVRDIDQIARRTIRAVRDGTADYLGAQCPGFESE